MGRVKKSFRQYTKENDEGLRQKKLKKESRHNYKAQLEQVAHGDVDWDEFEDESESRHYRR